MRKIFLEKWNMFCWAVHKEFWKMNDLRKIKHLCLSKQKSKLEKIRFSQFNGWDNYFLKHYDKFVKITYSWNKYSFMPWGGWLQNEKAIITYCQCENEFEPLNVNFTLGFKLFIADFIIYSCNQKAHPQIAYVVGFNKYQGLNTARIIFPPKGKRNFNKIMKNSNQKIFN